MKKNPKWIESTIWNEKWKNDIKIFNESKSKIYDKVERRWDRKQYLGRTVRYLYEHFPTHKIFPLGQSDAFFKVLDLPVRAERVTVWDNVLVGERDSLSEWVSVSESAYVRLRVIVCVCQGLGVV